MDVDKEWLPQWGWLLVALFGLAMVANLANLLVFGPIGLPEEYHIVPIIAAMVPAIIFVGIWYDEDRHHYWDHSRLRIVGDLVFVVAATAIGAAFATVFVVDIGIHQIVRDIIAMTVGFVMGWVLFWFRNPSMYRND